MKYLLILLLIVSSLTLKAQVKLLTLSELEQRVAKGKDTTYVINFWATWCGPCRKYIPLLNVIHQKYADKLAVVGLSNENEAAVKSFNDPKINYFEAIDTEGTLMSQLEVKGIPHVILIDPKGIVRWEGYPLLTGYPLTEKVLTDLMEKYKN